MNKILTAGFAVFLARALGNVGIYVEHAGRTSITPDDIIRGLQLEVFKFGNRDTFDDDMSLAMDTLTRELSSDSSEDVQTPPSAKGHPCSCDICVEMNDIENKYCLWIPQNPLEEYVHSAIETAKIKLTS